MDDVTITFLGTGGAIPPPNRFQSSIALRHPHGLVIFDVGEGAQYNLRKFQIPVRKEITIAICHAHADHYQGIAGMLASFNMLERKDPINLLVPKDLADYIKLLLHACHVQTSFDINYVEMQPGSVFKGKGYQIIATKALHFKNALGFKWQEDNRPGKWNKALVEEYQIPNKLRAQLSKGKTIEINGRTITPEEMIGPERKGRVIVYSGDTRYNHSLIEFAENADVLIHEATYPSSFEIESEEREHSTVSQAAKLAKFAKVDIVLLTHFGSRVLNLKEEKKLANAIHPSILAKDGFEYIVKFKN